MMISEKTKVLNEIESRELLKKYNINQNNYLFMKEIDTSLEGYSNLRFPLVMKVVSEKIIHKSDFGGVQLNLKDENDVKKAYQKILTNALSKNISSDEIEGVIIQDMEFGLEEMFVGVKRDAVFGTIILVGFGGVLVELMQDVTLGICPLSDEEIYNMLKKLKGFPLLQGYRGRGKADVDSLIELIKTVQNLALKENDILEMDLNPVIVKQKGKGSVAVDARIVVSKN